MLAKLTERSKEAPGRSPSKIIAKSIRAAVD